MKRALSLLLVATSAFGAESFSGGEATFTKIKKLLLEKYYRADIKEDDLYAAAARGMLQHLDEKLAPYNELLGPDEVRELQNDAAGEIVGAGIEIQFDSPSGMIEILSVMPNSAAASAGLKAGDRILEIDGKSYKGKSFRDVVYEIRGKVGEARRLSVLRGAKVLSEKLRLRKVSYESVSVHDLGGGTTLLTLQHFAGNTPAQLRERLQGHAMKSLVVDLRGNSGGIFDKVIETTGMFLPKGEMIARLVKRGGAPETFMNKSEPLVGDIPIAVLVDHGTSCGAELLAQVLREKRKATIVGSATLGKWSMQSVEDLTNGYAVKYTVGTFASPEGKAFDGIGLQPDVGVPLEESQIPRLRAMGGDAARLEKDAPLRAVLSLLRSRT